MANNFAEAMQQGYAFGSQQRQEREHRNRLAELEGLSSKVISGDLDATSRAYALDPNQAKTLQGEGDRRRQRLYGLATSLKRAEQNPQLQAALYRSAVPYMRSEFGDEIPDMFDAATVMPVVEQVLAMGAPQSSGGPYADLPSDIRSLKLLQEDPELAKLDRERRQAGGMVPKLVQTAQGYGWGTPGSSIELAPMGGVAGQSAAAPQRQDMEADIALANDMIAAGIPSEQVDAFIASRGQRVPAPAAPAPSTGGIAQPYQSPGEQQRLALAQEANSRAARAEARADRAEQRQVAANAVTGKPPTEGERKAATLLQRLSFSQQQLADAVKEDPGAASPGVMQSGVRAVLGDSAANSITPAARQRVEAAQLDILDAALTLGTGAAYTREQLEGYRRSYFPQIGDSKATIDDKAARLKNVIQSAKIAAGRAAPQEGQSGGGRSIVRTGTSNGRKVIQYSDGTIEYGN